MESELTQRWPIKPEHRQAVVDAMVDILESETTTTEDATAAARVLVSAEKQNQADEHHTEGEKLNITGGLTLQAADAREAMLQDPEYLEFLRHKAMTNAITPALANGTGKHESHRNSSGNGHPGTNGNGHQ